MLLGRGRCRSDCATTATAGAANLSTRGLSQDSGRLASTTAADRAANRDAVIAAAGASQPGQPAAGANGAAAPSTADRADFAAEHGVRICGRDGWVLAPGQGWLGPLEHALDCWYTVQLQPVRAGAPESTVAPGSAAESPGSAARPCVPADRCAYAAFQELL